MPKKLRQEKLAKNRDRSSWGLEGFHGGFGSATLQECLDRINQSRTDAPATCHSGVKSEESCPPQVMSPNVEEDQIHETTSVKDHRQMTSHNLESKEERKEEDVTPKSEAATVGTKDEPAEHDSEDSLRPEQMGEELRRLIAEFPPSADSTPRQLDEQRGATAPCAPREFDGPYAPRRSTRSRGRAVSPDPLMFHHTIWLEHDREAAAHEEPVTQIRQELSTIQANLETLRTRLGQVADLRDAQGLREGQRMLTTRIAEVEDCISVQNLREFMRRIMRLEAQVGGNHGGVLGEAIRACHLRLDSQTAAMEEFQARIRARDWYHDLSEQESDEEIRQIVSRAEGQEANVENQSGVENRPFGRRRARNHAPQRRTQR